MEDIIEDITIEKIFSYLVYPKKKEGAPEEVIGTEIPLEGVMFKKLSDIFNNAKLDCNIPICFNSSKEGKQKNETRDKLIEFLKDTEEKSVKILAEKLQNVTTGRSGLGLLFFTYGKNKEGCHKLVISRFPADQGILAEKSPSGLEVSYVEKVFLKNSLSYKSVVYFGTSFDEDFWDGKAIDRQINNKSIAEYWIKHFLDSSFKITPKTGTRQLALAFKKSISIGDKRTKQELMSATNLLSNCSGDSVSISGLMNKFSFSDKTRELIMKNLSNRELSESSFQFDSTEFSKYIKYVSKELDTGAILTAPSGKFDECYQQKKSSENGVVEFCAKGRVVNQRLKSKKF